MGITPKEIAALLNNNLGAAEIDVPGMGMQPRENLIQYLTSGYGDLEDLYFPETVHAVNLANVHRADLKLQDDGTYRGTLTADEGSGGSGDYTFSVQQNPRGKWVVGDQIYRSDNGPVRSTQPSYPSDAIDQDGRFIGQRETYNLLSPEVRRYVKPPRE